MLPPEHPDCSTGGTKFLICSERIDESCHLKHKFDKLNQGDVTAVHTFDISSRHSIEMTKQVCANQNITAAN